MKFLLLGTGAVCLSMIAAQTAAAQSPATVKVLGCLQGDGSDEKPWVLSGVAIPAPPAAAPAGGGRGAGGGAGGAAGGNAARGGGAGAGGAAPAGAPGGAAGAQGGGGRGGRGGGGAAAPTPAPAARVPLVDLKLAGGMDMKIWRGMKVEVEGALGTRPASGLQELRVTSAHSVQGVCTPK